MSPRARSLPGLRALPNDRRRYEITMGALRDAGPVARAPDRPKQSAPRAVPAHSGCRSRLLLATDDVILAKADETSIVQPDILYMRPTGWRSEPARDRGRPTLAVEILSRRRDDRSRDEAALRALWRACLWLADPTRARSSLRARQRPLRPRGDHRTEPVDLRPCTGSLVPDRSP